MLMVSAAFTTVTVGGGGGGGGWYFDTLYSLNAPSFTTGNLHNRSFQEEPKRLLTGTKMPKIPLALPFFERRSTVKAQTLLRTFTSNSYFNVSNSNIFFCLFGKSLLRSSTTTTFYYWILYSVVL
jgi:hypothetical protein